MFGCPCRLALPLDTVGYPANQIQGLKGGEMSDLKKCDKCDGEGWLDPIGPCSDGSYITMRPCPRCRGDGHLGTLLEQKLDGSQETA